MSKQVSCINKRGNHYDPYERIQAVGGVASGVRWKRSEDDAIRDVEADRKAYFVQVSGNSVWVIVATRNGRKYLKTEADGVDPNNLLALPECP